MKALSKSSLFRESGRGGAWTLVSCVGMCLTGQHPHTGGSPSCAACSCNTYCTCLDDISADAHWNEGIHPTYLAALSQRGSTVLHLDVLTMLGWSREAWASTCNTHIALRCAALYAATAYAVRRAESSCEADSTCSGDSAKCPRVYVRNGKPCP